MLSKLTDDLNNIQNLPDKPTLSAEQIKALFDKAGIDIKTYINDTLTSEIDDIVTAIQSGKIDTNKIINDLTTGGANNVASAEMIKELNNIKANSVHTHTKSQITDFAHTHSKADITDFAHTHSKSQITDFAHTHSKADITDFAHTHDDRYYQKSEVNNLVNARAYASHTHNTSSIEGLKSGATTKITYGQGAPYGGEDGDVYIQYFT